MVSTEDVDHFLKEFKAKMIIWGVLFLNRGKNIQTLSDLEITPIYREQILQELENKDYSEGPVPDRMLSGADMWIFGRRIKNREVYIKITMGNPGLSVVCISFHLAEYPMIYPLK